MPLNLSTLGLSAADLTPQAYLLARQDPIYADIAKRIHSLYFLGTPHRGADSSAFVTTLISMSIGSGSKAFVKELVPGSGTLQVIFPLSYGDEMCGVGLADAG
jgi:hypothetical protein